MKSAHVPDSCPEQVLSYESYSRAPIGPRRWWVFAVLGIYLLLATSFLTSPLWAGGTLGLEHNQIIVLASLVTILTLCSLALLIVPVRARRRRPITRRSIIIPIVASGLLMGSLIFGAGIALAELFAHNPSDSILWTIIAAALVVWIAWSVVLILASRSGTAESLGMRLHRHVFAGSLLELLVAVPTHIIVRRRNECCAGFLTGTGICIGVVVALVSFGPTFLLLYHKRRKQITGGDKVLDS